MLDDKRIKEAEQNVKNYLEEGLIKKQQREEIVLEILIKNSKQSLEVANLILKNNKSDLWIIVCSYYSMYYIANAVIYKTGYKIGDKVSHKVTADALIVFVRKRLTDSLIQTYEEIQNEALATMKSNELIKNFDYERRKRGDIQYHTKETIKHSKALTSFERAKEFILEMEKLLED